MEKNNLKIQYTYNLYIYLILKKNYKKRKIQGSTLVNWTNQNLDWVGFTQPRAQPCLGSVY